MLLLSIASCVLCILRYAGMKRPGLTLHDIVHETCSTLDMQLVLHKWLCGCLFILAYLRSNLQRVINNTSINVVVLVRKLERHLLKAPNHVKYAKKVEASNFVLQGCAVM